MGNLPKVIRQCTRILTVFTTLGLVTLSANAQQLPAIEIANQHPLVKAFQACVSATGLEHDLPTPNVLPKFDSKGHLYQLNEVGRIRDGYRHFLYVSPDGKTIYIQQIGGIAGTTKYFGPLDPAKHCPQNSAKSGSK